MQLEFSFIIPVYNRPGEVHELLESFCHLDGAHDFEVVIVEDGSTTTSEDIVNLYAEKLNISYYFKPNSGPGDSRNYGMKKAQGNYFIILDSDCVLPSDYTVEVKKSLQNEFVDCFGGPDTAQASFSNLQKAINFAMTSVISTGGIRGNKHAVGKFQPRSFNMGLSKKAFLATGGFGNIHPGEDPDLTIRLWDLGYKTKLIETAKVYHKRRISWEKFHQQVIKFGKVRPILNHWHPHTKKITYWFPTVFCLGLVASVVLAFLGIYIALLLYALYFGVAFLLALFSTKNLVVAVQALWAVGIQMVGYGIGFLQSTAKLAFSKKTPEELFPELFF